MSEPTLQSLAAQVQELVARLDGLTSGPASVRNEINRLNELVKASNAKIAALESGKFASVQAFQEDGDTLVINPDEDFDGVVIGGRLSTNDLRSPDSNPLEITAGQVRLHASDLILDGRSRALAPTLPFRALVDDGNSLIINFKGDYERGVHVQSSLEVVGDIILTPRPDLRIPSLAFSLGGALVNALTPGGDELLLIQGGGFKRVVVDGEFTAKQGIVSPDGDIAEQFDLADNVRAEPGTVLVIGQDGKLEPCTKGNDSSAAGVVSGAGELAPAFVLNKKLGHRAEIVLVGTAYCKCDARYGPIMAGDLLTTSATVGHAMCADETNLKIGAIIGKALKALPSGAGLVPILVAPR